MPVVCQSCENNIVLSFPNLTSVPQIDTWPWIMHRRASLPNDWTMFYLKWEQKAPRPWQGCFGGNQTLVFCAVAETEALMQCVGQMVGAGGAHWPLCVLLLDAVLRPLTWLNSAAPTESDLEAAKRETFKQKSVWSRRACGCKACPCTHIAKTRDSYVHWGRKKHKNPKAAIHLLYTGTLINTCWSETHLMLHCLDSYAPVDVRYSTDSATHCITWLETKTYRRGKIHIW